MSWQLGRKEGRNVRRKRRREGKGCRTKNGRSKGNKGGKVEHLLKCSFPPLAVRHHHCMVPCSVVKLAGSSHW
jgi:hypothetical protein